MYLQAVVDEKVMKYNHTKLECVLSEVKMIKAIVMDMDGTLLDSNNKILPETKAALIELEKKGVRLMLASGRSYTRLMPYAKELEMDKYNGYLLEVDGIAIYDVASNTRNVLKRMKPSEFETVFKYLMNIECESMACFDDGLFDYFNDNILELKKRLREELKLRDDHPWTAGPWSWLADMRDGYPKITYIKSFDEINREINKIQLMQDEDKLAIIYKDLLEKFNDDFEIFRTCPRQLEILPKGYSKGATLLRIMELNNWNKDEVLAFGDGENDVSMFEVVTNSYAMGQAKDYVKEKAKYATLSNNEQGIFKVLCMLDLV